LKWALSNDVDFIALSFVRDAQDVQNIKRRITEAGKRIPVIAKIERPEAVENIESILAVTDGIMVARGDLGIEINTERLPVVQKHLIQRANAHGRLVITATQMLESMIENHIPTRAETSDVANAIFDGTDAVMLSGETASGSFPIEAVAEMTRIAIEAERSPFTPTIHADEELSHFSKMDFAMTKSAQYLADQLDAHAVMVFSHGSEKAHLLSKLRSPFSYYCICYSEASWRRMALFWGVVPLHIEFEVDQNDLLESGIKAAMHHDLVQSNVQQEIVVLMGYGATMANSLKVIST
ncbi:MAG: pyruvate kinase, partial [Planctomycetes bacterium]|nr:pyruvate kinase [Planctomycetota bacterium]